MDRHSETLSDPVLQGCQVSSLCLPTLPPDNSQPNLVFRLEGKTSAFAIKFFGQPLSDQTDRFLAIKAALSKFPGTGLLTEFELQPQGIKIANDWLPVLKTNWLDGDSLNAFVHAHLDDHDKLATLASTWYGLCCKLLQEGIAHGEIEPSNVIVSNGVVRLIDYDSMVVPGPNDLELQITPTLNYCHPAAQGSALSAKNIDNFASWMIYASLSALSMDKVGWLKQFVQPARLLFTQEDFADIRNSAVIRAMNAHKDGAIQQLAKSIVKLCTSSAQHVPPLPGLSLTGARHWSVDFQTRKSPGPADVAAQLATSLPAEWKIICNKELEDPNLGFLKCDCIVIAPHTIFVLQCNPWSIIRGNENGWINEDGESFASTVVEAIGVSRRLSSHLKECLPALAHRSDHMVVGRALLTATHCSFSADEDKRFIVRLNDASNALIAFDASRQPATQALPVDSVYQSLLKLLKDPPDVPRRINAFKLLHSARAHGQVRSYPAEHDDGSSRVLKLIERPDSEGKKELENSWLREYHALKKLGKTGAAQTVDTYLEWTDKITKKDYWVLPLHPILGNSLHASRIAAVPAETDILQVVYNAFTSLNTIHKANVLHRALTPHRIHILDDGGVLFSDFLVARMSERLTVHQHSSELDPTSNYSAPECRLDLSAAQARSDVYSLAASLRYWITGEEPTVERETDRGISALRSDLGWRVSELLDEIFDRCLSTAANQRPLPEQIVEQIRSALPKQDDLFTIGQIVDNQYEIKQILGNTTNSTTYAAFDFMAKQLFVLKKIKQPLSAATLARQEFQMLMRVQHENLPRIFDIRNPENAFHLKLEYTAGITLSELMQSHKGDKELCLDVAISVLKALSYLANLGIVHRDVTPSNIIVPSPVPLSSAPRQHNAERQQQIKLIDFGIATTEKENRELVGSIRYRAPEVGLHPWTPSADIYALGVVLYELLTGHVPYREIGSELRKGDAVKRTKEEKTRFGALLDVLARACAYNSKSRFASAQEFIDALNTVDSGTTHSETPLTTSAGGKSNDEKLPVSTNDLVSTKQAPAARDSKFDLKPAATTVPASSPTDGPLTTRNPGSAVAVGGHLVLSPSNLPSDGSPAVKQQEDGSARASTNTEIEKKEQQRQADVEKSASAAKIGAPSSGGSAFTVDSEELERHDHASHASQLVGQSRPIWPVLSMYTRAIASYKETLMDRELQQCQIELDSVPQAKNYSITNAVFKFFQEGKQFSLKCFCWDEPDRQLRYQAIIETIKESRPTGLRDFSFQSKGIRIEQSWYPVIKMPWIEGRPLDDFLERVNPSSELIGRIADNFYTLIGNLSSHGIAHGDLEPGNIIVCADRDDIRLELIDYDTMFVPSLPDSIRSSGGFSNVHHQHPEQRKWASVLFDRSMDNFAAWIIFASLVALSLDPSLSKYTKDGRLLFHEVDFRDSTRSPLMKELKQHPLRKIRAIANSIEMLCAFKLTDVPPLLSPAFPGADEWAADRTVPHTTRSKHKQNHIILNDQRLADAVVVNESSGLVRAFGHRQLVFSAQTERGPLAIKCLQPDLMERYAKEIIPIIRHSKLPYFVQTELLTNDQTTNPGEGDQRQLSAVEIQAGDSTSIHMPAITMEWADGRNLLEQIDTHMDNGLDLIDLSNSFFQMMKTLGNAQIEHANLDAGSIIVGSRHPKPHSNSDHYNLKLIDYDLLFARSQPSKNQLKNSNPHYQHPERLTNSWWPEVDNFGAWVIFSSIRICGIDPEIYAKFHFHTDHLLFQEADFHSPERSKLFAALKFHRSANIRALTEWLSLLATDSIKNVPPLYPDNKLLSQMGYRNDLYLC